LLLTTYLLSHRRKTPVNERLHRPHATAEEARGILLRQVLVEAQDERAALPVGQLAQRNPQLFPKSYVRLRGEVVCASRGFHVRPFLAQTPEVLVGEVHDGLSQVARQGVPPAKVGEARKRPHERFLHQILGDRSVSCQ
jgi:hypothetical protein